MKLQTIKQKEEIRKIGIAQIYKKGEMNLYSIIHCYNI